MNKFLYSILVIIFLYGCKIQKELYYSYKVNGYVIDTGKHLFTTSSLISYGDYLFEFKERINIKETQHGEDSPLVSSTFYDTIGVYLLENKNMLYYEFDTFAIKNTLLKTGKFVNKEFGVRLKSPDSAISSKSAFYKPIPRDTIINNIKCFYADIVYKDKSTKDSFEQRVLLIKNINFNSFYKISGEKFVDREFCIVGVYIYNLKQKEGFLEEINSMKPLTEKEKNICESMVIKSQACITDTIKGIIK